MASPSWSFGASGRAPARDSRVVISFFEGRRVLVGFLLAFSIRLTRDECLIRRLSSLLVREKGLSMGVDCVVSVLEDIGWEEEGLAERDRIEVRFLGI